MQPTGFLVMGVSGSGKSTFGKALAQQLGWDFFDADDFHPQENIDKMAAGISLDDSDRMPWLASLHDQLVSTLKADRHPVLACSALKEKYRLQLLDGMDDVTLIYLKGSYDVLWSRLAMREGHFMKPAMLQSQFDTLEAPQKALVLPVDMSLNEMLDTIMAHYFRKRSS